jgi:hypothetical protein
MHVHGVCCHTHLTIPGLIAEMMSYGSDVHTSRAPCGCCRSDAPGGGPLGAAANASVGAPDMLLAPLLPLPLARPPGVPGPCGWLQPPLLWDRASSHARIMNPTAPLRSRLVAAS